MHLFLTEKGRVMPIQTIFYSELTDEMEKFNKGELLGFKHLKNLDNLTLEESCQEAVSDWFHALNRYHRDDPRATMPIDDLKKNTQNGFQTDHFLADALLQQNVILIHCICRHFGGPVRFETDYYKKRTALLHSVKRGKLGSVKALIHWIELRPIEDQGQLFIALLGAPQSKEYKMVHQYVAQLSKAPRDSDAFQLAKLLSSAIFAKRRLLNPPVALSVASPPMTFSLIPVRSESPRDTDSAMLPSPMKTASSENELIEAIHKYTL